jgi:predicted membrane chloride channel (bestrophin family)
MISYRTKIKTYIDIEVQAAEDVMKSVQLDLAFAHLERTHILSQASRA